MNPNKSVAKPGVIRKIPDRTINKPSLNAFIKFCGSVIPDNFKKFNVLVPSRLIKKLPIIAVKITNRIVSSDPMNLPTIMNKYISTNGTEIKIKKNRNIISMSKYYTKNK